LTRNQLTILLVSYNFDETLGIVEPLIAFLIAPNRGVRSGHPFRCGCVKPVRRIKRLHRVVRAYSEGERERSLSDRRGSPRDQPVTNGPLLGPANNGPVIARSEGQRQEFKVVVWASIVALEQIPAMVINLDCDLAVVNVLQRLNSNLKSKSSKQETIDIRFALHKADFLVQPVRRIAIGTTGQVN
jgi:hypothetical protein